MTKIDILVNFDQNQDFSKILTEFQIFNNFHRKLYFQNFKRKSRFFKNFWPKSKYLQILTQVDIFRKFSL